ncbi:MAG: PLP-dependent transferase [Myxococcales bacterium]|nr:PLP-dependent transferase [Myxococcales bacterium]
MISQSQSAMFEYEKETSYDDLKYIRLDNTPNQLLAAQRLALLEGAEAGLVTETHPDHDNAKGWFQGFGGVLSFEPSGGIDAAERFINQVELALRAPSLGGVETLLSRPAAASHLGVPREERLRMGITDALVRIAVGIEALDDLLEDVAQALD